MGKITDKILNTIKVKVYKKEPDDRTSLCGEPMQTDEKGDYFEIPAHLADYIKAVHINYEVTEEFIPDVESKKGTK